MKLGRCYVADVIGIDPFKEIQAYTGGVLIVHGTKDKIVHVDYAKKAFEAYTAQKAERVNEHVKLHIIENAKHGFSKKHNAIALAEVEKFIRI